MNVLSISSYDVMGSRFNGFDWQDGLSKFGVESKMLVGTKQSQNTNWVESFSKSNALVSSINKIERMKSGSSNNIFDTSKYILDHPFYIESDLIHLQIILDGTLDLATIKKIISEKPTVWTWHDPSFTTGHCVTPMDCFRWKQGCGSCPDLERPFTVSKDNTAQNMLARKPVLQSDATIHVTTSWMENLVRSHPWCDALNIRTLPFGLDLQAFSIQKAARHKYGISETATVLGIRAINDTYKDFSFFKEALERTNINKEFVVLTIGEIGLLSEEKLSRSIEIIELPWTTNTASLVEFYNLLDLFISPSRFETFGLMGLEAMACGIPVLGVEASAVAEICNLSNLGIEIPKDDINMFSMKIENFVLNKSKNMPAKVDIRKYVEENFGLGEFLQKLSLLYYEAYESFKSEKL